MLRGVEIAARTKVQSDAGVKANQTRKANAEQKRQRAPQPEEAKAAGA
jgi:hypothetical protein